LVVRQIKVGPMVNFVYLVVDKDSHEAAAIDSGWETEPIVRAATEMGAKVRYAVATHEHFDHTSTLRELSDRLGAKVVAHEDSPIDCDVRVTDRQRLKLGGTSLKVLHTPGHTQDSICLYDGRNVFTGDTLFVDSIGKFERADGESIFRSIHAIMQLPGSTLMYPGHDYGDVPSRTLQEEGQANPFLMARDLRSFLSLFS
jgi:glyoxylase-like metal-dependent hydrolase (beta-lactamase superfamily II)